jgi:hypothetical protein
MYFLLLFHVIKTNYTGDKIPLTPPPLKVAIKVIYSHGIKVFYAGVVFESLWYLFEIWPIRNKNLYKDTSHSHIEVKTIYNGVHS